MNFLASFVVFFGLLRSTYAFSTGAGRCVVGEPSPQGNHPDPSDGGGELAVGDFSITVDGNPITENITTVTVEEPFEIVVSGPDFKGFLVMLADQEEGALLGRMPEAQQATGAGCAGTASVTHTSNDQKQSVTLVGIIPEATTTTIELNVVVTNSGGESLYYYTQVPLLVVEPTTLPIDSAPPSISPTIMDTTSPTLAPIAAEITRTSEAPSESPSNTPDGNATEAPSVMNSTTLVPSSAPTATPMPSDTPSSAPLALPASDVPSSTPSSAPIEPLPELTTQAPVPLQDGDEICDEGFIMDNYCLALGMLLDNPDVVTLENPEQHSFHCLLDVAVCWQSNYTMLREPAESESLYSVAYEFDGVGSALLRELGQSVGMNGYCESCIAEVDGQEFGFRAVVKGIVVDASVDPPLIDITAVYASNGTITDEVVSFCNSTGTEPPVMPNVTEAPNATAPPDLPDSSAAPLPETFPPMPEDTGTPSLSPTLGDDTSSASAVQVNTVVLFFVLTFLVYV